MSKRAILPMREDGFARKKWSVSDCKFLVDGGLLEPGSYELIEGEIVFKMSQSRPHIRIVNKATFLLADIFGRDSIQSQAQIGIGERDEFNDPEPDIAVLRGSLDDYLDQEPNPATDVLLLLEVSNTSLQGDKTVKAGIYARHGLPDYWVAAIRLRQLIVHRQPTADGYADVQTYNETDSVAPLAAPASLIRVADLFP